MSNQELVELVEGIQIKPSQILRKLKCHHQELLREIIGRTDFLEEPDSPILARLFCLKNNLTGQPTCRNPGCNHKVHWNRNNREFFHHCSPKCRNEDPDVQERMKATTMERFGVEHAAQSKEVQKRQRDTTRKRFGVEYASQTREFQERVRRTNMVRFNKPSFSQTNEFKLKSRDACQRRFHVDHYSKTDEFRQKCMAAWMRNLHVTHPMKIDAVRRKVKDTMMERYGAECYSQTIEFAKKSHMPYTNPKYPGVRFATSWEFRVYDFLTENNMEFEYQPSISIPYEYMGTHHTYHPDFRVGDRIVEVKGDHFFRINEETGKEEMFLPWRKPGMSDEEYRNACGLYEAKHQCMLTNGVTIIRSKELSDLKSTFMPCMAEETQPSLAHE